MREITYDQFKQLEADGERFLLDLYLVQCEPCGELKTILEEDVEPGLDFPIFKMDILLNRKIYHELGLKKSPTVVLFDNGRELGRVVLKQDVEEYLKLASTTEASQCPA